MSAHEWPPLVGTRNIPAWIRVRDFVLTLGAWGLFAWWARGGIAIVVDWLTPPLFELSSHEPPDWIVIWTFLAPFLFIAALLAAWLVAWAAQRRRILTQQRDPTQPAPLAVETHAARFDLAPEDVAALRARTIATVRFEDDGRIEPGQSFT